MHWRSIDIVLISSIQDIQDILTDDAVRSVQLSLTASQARQTWPFVVASVNDKIWKGTVEKHQQLVFDDLDPNSDLVISIDYMSKQDNDTVLHDGRIVENKTVQIDHVVVNDLQIQGTDLLDLVFCKLELNDNQISAYQQLGINWTDMKTLTLYDNGHWMVILEHPVIANLIKRKNHRRAVYETSHRETLENLRRYFDVV